MNHRIQLRLIVALLLLVWLWAAIAPLSRSDWLLENLLVLFYGALLAATHRRFAFSRSAHTGCSPCSWSCTCMARTTPTRRRRWATG